MNLDVGMVCGHVDDHELGDQRPAVVEGQPREGHILGMIEHRLDHLAVDENVRVLARRPGRA